MASPQVLNVSVLDLSQSPGAGFATSLLADFGARVYLAEKPPHGSALRAIGPIELGDRWWDIIARNKRSIAIDPSRAGAESVVARVLASVDMVMTDIGKPNWAADPWLRHVEAVLKPPLVVDLFSTGADRPERWPWSIAPELSSAATGMLAITGFEGGPPMQPEMPLAEYLSGALAATGALAELRRAKRDDVPPVNLPVGLHEAVLRAIEWQVPVATAFGKAEGRIGNRFPMNAGVSNMHRTRDGKHVALSAATQAVAERLMIMIGGKELAQDPRFASPMTRLDHMPALYESIDTWVAQRTAEEVFAAAREADVVIGPIYTVDDILADRQIAARGNIVRSERGVPMPGVVPTVSNTRPAVHGPGPSIGQHTAEALELAGYIENDIARLHEAGVIWRG